MTKADGSAWNHLLVETALGRVSYNISGTGAPVVAIYGNMASGKWFTLPDAPTGLMVVAPDMSGFGESNKPGIQDIGYYAEAALVFMDALSINKASLIGH